MSDNPMTDAELSELEDRIAKAEATMAYDLAKRLYAPLPMPTHMVDPLTKWERFKRSVRWRWLGAREWVARTILRVELLADHECDQ